MLRYYYPLGVHLLCSPFTDGRRLKRRKKNLFFGVTMNCRENWLIYYKTRRGHCWYLLVSFACLYVLIEWWRVVNLKDVSQPTLFSHFQVEREAHGCHGGRSTGHPDCDSSSSRDQSGSSTRNPCTEVRRYAVVALTNLTFGNAQIKSFLCSFAGFIPIMVGQLESPFETLRKATAHLFRNLAWKADKNSKQVNKYEFRH
jgi:hypothetical protein